jgi:hypothetical protein
MGKLIKRVNLMKCFQALIIAVLTMALAFSTPVSGAGVAQPITADNPPLPKPVGRVVWVKGVLKAVMENNEERILQKTSLIYEKDTLITDQGSQAQIVFTDNTLMTFREGSKFVISQYSYKPSNQGGSVGKYVMSLIEGGFRTITGAIAKSNPSDYQVNTPVATIGVRGTDYAIYLNHGELYVGYYTGKPCVRNNGGKQEELCLDPQNPYGYVQSVNIAPVPVNQRPEVFREKLEIVPAHITPFSATDQAPVYTPKGGGPISSFCITQ